MGSSREDKDDDSSFVSDSSSSSDYSSSYSSFYSSSSSSTSSFDEFTSRKDTTHYFFQFSSLLRKRRTGNNNNNNNNNDSARALAKDDNDDHAGDSDDHSTERKKRTRTRAIATQYKDESSRKQYHWSSRLLIATSLFWCGAQITTTTYIHQQTLGYILTDVGQKRNYYHSQQEQEQYQRYHDGDNHRYPKNYPDHHYHHPHHPSQFKNKKKKESVAEKEKLEPGCELDPAWQTPDSNSNLLSCQILHEIDLTEALSGIISSSRRRKSLSSSVHLGSGLWRDVWKIDVNNKKDRIVVKTMKLEHEVTTRNLERHRREAATMNRLTTSSYVTDLYAYCGNSILTEYATQDLSSALSINSGSSNGAAKKKETERRKKNENRLKRTKEYKESISHHSEGLHNNYTLSSSSSSSIGSDVKGIIYENSERYNNTKNTTGIQNFASKSSRLFISLADRLNLSLQASKAVAALHRSDVIHADITTKQFLVIFPQDLSVRFRNREDNNHSANNYLRIKINDFNRCRFIPRRRQHKNNHTIDTYISNNDTSTKNNSRSEEKTNLCKIRIPSAPGKYRSPEEYSDKYLDFQMDVYSLGHVLYEIWTGGQNPWNDFGGKRIKNTVMNGLLPKELQILEEEYLDPRQSGRYTQQQKKQKDSSSLKIDRKLGLLIRECYRVDPKQRITAEKLVIELLKLIEMDRLQMKNT